MRRWVTRLSGRVGDGTAGSNEAFLEVCKIPEHTTVGSCKVAHHQNVSSGWRGQHSPLDGWICGSRALLSSWQGQVTAFRRAGRGHFPQTSRVRDTTLRLRHPRSTWGPGLSGQQGSPPCPGLCGTSQEEASVSRAGRQAHLATERQRVVPLGDQTPRMWGVGGQSRGCG